VIIWLQTKGLPPRAGPQPILREANTAIATRPHAGIAMRAVWCTSRRAHQQPQETGDPSTSLLPRARPPGTAIADRGPVGVAARLSSQVVTCGPTEGLER
jgi:hypothetical protein